tara:strand:- start:133 stop:615 length:483 start_codon:yes stop_codon:yes gene_type:complete
MISEYTKDHCSKILNVINDAAFIYKGTIPDDCWHEPYMPKHELENEFKNGVRMFGYLENNELIGVIGFQKTKDVILIRHAYTLTKHQGTGKGTKLLKFLLEKNKNSRLLVGTWKSATWAIKFYEKFGFKIHNKEQSSILLKKYWSIPSKQIENSVVLEKY